MLSIRIALGALLVQFACAVPAATPATSLQSSDTLVDALEKYRASGVRIVYSNRLVPPDLEVVTIPDPSTDLKTQLATLLSPHGLTVRRTQADVWYVVAVPAVPTPGREVVVEPAPETVEEPAFEEMWVISPRQRLTRTATSGQNLSITDLRNIPSMGGDLLRAVTTLPGQASNGLSVRQRIRGGDADEVLYLIDGARLIDPFHLKDFLSPFSALNQNIVEWVDVYNAGFPSRYGNRASGVVDLNITETEEAFAGTLDVNLLGVSAHVQGARGAWQWLASARRGTLDLVLGALQEDYGEPDYHDVLLRASRQTDRSRFTLGLTSLQDDVELASPGIGEAGQSRNDNLLGWLKWSQVFRGGSEISVHGDFNRVRSSRWGNLDNPTDAIGDLQESRDFDVYRLALRWAGNGPGNSTLHAGAEFEKQRGDFAASLFSIYGPLGLPVQPEPVLDRSFSTRRSGDMLGLYGSLLTRFHEQWELELGFRYDTQHINPIHDQRLSPRLQLNYAPGENTDIHLNLGRYVQHQNLYELQLDDGLLELQAPQLADQLSIGIEHRFGGELEMRMAAYYKRVRSPLLRFDNLYNRYVLLPELHGDRVMVAPDRARSYGLEMTLSGNAWGDVFWKGSYVLAEAEERFDGDWRPRPWDQHHALRGSLDRQQGRWRFAASLAYHSGWATTALVTAPGPPLAGYNDRRLPAFVSFDVSVSRHWALAASDLEVYLDVSNLTNRRNIGGYQYNLAPDTGWRRDGRRLLPIIPTLGVRWSW